MYFVINNQAIGRLQPNLAKELDKQSPAIRIPLMNVSSDVPDVDALIVVGLPTVEGVIKILASRTPTVIINHDDLSQLRTYLTQMDIHKYISVGRISFAVGQQGVLQNLNDIFGTLYRRNIVVFGDSAHTTHAAAIKDVRFFDTLCSSNRATLDQFAIEWQDNISDNLPGFIHGPFIQDARDRWIGGKAIVMGAGPSLDDIQLTDYVGMCPLIACDTAAPVLSGQHIIPDMIVTLDASVSNQTYLQDLDKEIYERSILCVTPLVHRSVYEKFKRLLFFSYGHPTLDYLREIGIPLDAVASGGSVALTAIDIARILGIKDIYLIGVDFQFYPYRTHAHGTGTALRCVRTNSRFVPLELSMYEHQVDLEPIKINDDAQILTDRKYLKWKEWLEIYLKNHDVCIHQMAGRSHHVEGISRSNPSQWEPGLSLDVQKRGGPHEFERDRKFLMKEIEMALSSDCVEIIRRVVALPRINRCLGYILAWSSDKPQSTAAKMLIHVLKRFYSGLQVTTE